MDDATVFVVDDGVVGLRWFELGDVDAVTEACQDPEISRWTATVPFPYVRADAMGWISGHDEARAAGRSFSFAIVEVVSGALAGSIGVIRKSSEVGVVGYWVAAPARCRGVATRALGLVSAWAFEHLSIERLQLDTMIGNVASERVAARNGFVIVEAEAALPHAVTDEVFTVNRWELHRP